MNKRKICSKIFEYVIRNYLNIFRKKAKIKSSYQIINKCTNIKYFYEKHKDYWMNTEMVYMEGLYFDDKENL